MEFLNKEIYKSLFILFLVLVTMNACGDTETQNTRAERSGREVVQTGASVLVHEKIELLRGKQVGLIVNHTAVVEENHLIDLLHDAGIEIVALFSPEHGIRGDVDANERVDDSLDEKTGAPIYSLFGDNEKPNQDMIENLDLLIFDIQDIGTRFYTYTTTLGYSMQSAAEHEIPFMVLDRPNPIGGNSEEGFVLQPGFETFVGLYPIPVSHGLTVAELAQMIKGVGMLDGLENLDLQVIKMKNWSRDMLWPETGLRWIPPSPNIPTFETALVYQGSGFFERTTASEGRGTYEPFTQLGAPWIDGQQLATELNEINLPGIKFEAVSYIPKSIEGMESHPNWEGEEVHGIKYVVTDPHKVKPVASGVHVLKAFYNASIHKNQHDFLSESIQDLAGNSRFYEMIGAGVSATEIVDSWKEELHQFSVLKQQYHLYE